MLELKYIKAFTQEDLYEKVDECQCLAQIETAIDKIQSGTLESLVAMAESSVDL